MLTGPRTLSTGAPALTTVQESKSRTAEKEDEEEAGQARSLGPTVTVLTADYQRLMLERCLRAETSVDLRAIWKEYDTWFLDLTSIWDEYERHAASDLRWIWSEYDSWVAAQSTKAAQEKDRKVPAQQTRRKVIS